MAEERVMLVGEAAGVDPLLGEGIAQSIASGALAADYLVERLAADRLDFGDWRRTFARSATGVDVLARTAALQFLRTPARRRLLEAVTLRAPEALDVTTSLFAGLPIPKRSALTALRRLLP
jgi:flavin-dependent dehydrogenase